MIKMDIDDFIYEIREELICYEEIGEEGADKWEAEFREWLSLPGGKDNVEGKGDKVKFLIADESEIFDIADSYLEAVENDSIKNYWKSFR